jgi:HEAT repeat protein
LIGKLRGESFFAGRSTSYWRLALVSEDPAIRENAYKTLHTGGADSVGVLIESLRTQDASASGAELRWTAAELLGKIGPAAKTAAPALLAALEDPDPHVRSVSATAVPEVETPAPAAVPALQKLLATESGRTAARALSKYRGEARPAIPDLIDMLDNKQLDTETRWNAARTLGKIGPGAESAIPTLVAHLEDEAESVREHAAEALGDIGPEAKDAVPALIVALTDPATKVRRDAVRSLGQIGPDSRAALPAIQTLLTDPEKIVVEAAQVAIRLIQGDEPSTETPSTDAKPDPEDPSDKE